MYHNGVAWKLDPLNHYERQSPVDIAMSMGLIPEFLHAHDERAVLAQLEQNYGFGPLHAITGGTVDETGVYRYPEDPPLYPIAETQLKGTKVRMYPYAIMHISSADTEIVTRMD
jgi:hypothetical protein